MASLFSYFRESFSRLAQEWLLVHVHKSSSSVRAALNSTFLRSVFDKMKNDFNSKRHSPHIAHNFRGTQNSIISTFSSL